MDRVSQFEQMRKRDECAGIVATYQMSAHEVAAECESSGTSLRFAQGLFCCAQLSKHKESLAFTPSCRWTTWCNCATVQLGSGQTDLPAFFRHFSLLSISLIFVFYLLCPTSHLISCFVKKSPRAPCFSFSSSHSGPLVLIKMCHYAITPVVESSSS